MDVQKNSIIEKVTKVKLPDSTFIILIAISYAVVDFIYEMQLYINSYKIYDFMSYTAGLVTIANSVLYIIWAFKAKAALQEYALRDHKIDLKMNIFYTFFFTVYCINYCINDFQSRKRKMTFLNNTN